MKLVIVESPAKAKTINKYLGADYKVVASFGHIRDLPSKNGSVLPDEDFAMKYEISEKSGKYVSEITKLAKDASAIYLATDPDREGEAISWHVAEILKEKKVVKSDDLFKRVAFNEITKKAVLDAVAHPRSIDTNLVNAQQARRALDYLVGFTLSPVLWRKLPGCKSAGRVQSVALRLICEREDEIEHFVTQEYWDITLDMLTQKGEPFSAKLTHIDGKKLEKFSITDKPSAAKVQDALKAKNFVVHTIEKKKQNRHPAAPFITSSLQQEASRKLGFSAKKTMQVAQKLYEGVDLGGETVGLITYMRTDGVTLASDAVSAIRDLIQNEYGKEYLPSSPRLYKSKAKNAQEAHEAIRPTNINLKPDSIAAKLDKDQAKLYDLIWRRTVACQMESVVMDMVAVNIEPSDGSFTARATGSTIAFDGFYKLYMEGRDDTEEESSNLLPPLKEKEALATKAIRPEQHFTEPPPRYSESSLVKKLEELGIGRPSTYASIISVLQDRKYATLEKKRFLPSEIGRLLVVFLVQFFAKYVQYDFTAELEADLDKIAEGDLGWKKLLQNFWTGFSGNIGQVSGQKMSDVIQSVEAALSFHLYGKEGSSEYEKNKKCPSCANGQLGLKLGKYGAFLACSNYPDCNFKKQIAASMQDADGTGSEGGDAAKAENNAVNKELGTNKEGETIFLKKGPYGFYIQQGEAKSAKDKPKRVPLPAIFSSDSLTLEMALKVLALPANIGVHPTTKEEMLVGIGKFGPYVKYQGKFVSIPRSMDPFSLDVDAAIRLIELKAAKQEKKAKK